MKKLLVSLMMTTGLLIGCQTYTPTQAEVRSSNMQAAHTQTRAEVTACVDKLNAEPVVILMNQEILIKDIDSSNKFELLTNKNKLSEKQKLILTRAIPLLQKCRTITIEGLKSIPILSATYQTYYSNLDVIYKKLLTKESSIGDANQMKLDAMTKLRQDLVTANKIINDEIKSDYNNEVAVRDRDRQARIAAYGVFMQQQQTQQIINQQNQNAIKNSMPVQTNCYKSGNTVNCTSY